MRVFKRTIDDPTSWEYIVYVEVVIDGVVGTRRYSIDADEQPWRILQKHWRGGNVSGPPESTYTLLSSTDPEHKLVALALL